MMSWVENDSMVLFSILKIFCDAYFEVDAALNS